MVVKLYGENVKPKAHHLFHVVDGMEWLGKLLACFVTERKHRTVKHAALYIFRHLEHTVLVDLVNTCFQQVIDGHDLYKAVWQVRPSSVDIGGRVFLRSRSAVLMIGMTSAGDVVMTETGIVGRIVNFWQAAGEETLYAAITAYECINNDTRFRSTERSQQLVCDSGTIVDALVWVWESPAIMRVSIPRSVLY